MKKKLAIISTFDDLCGIASYTRSIVRQLQDYYDITVFDLDQVIFKSKSKRVSELAEKEVYRICQNLPNFDAVNIQLEHGTLGNTPAQIKKRLFKFFQSANKLTVTFHTIIHSEKVTENFFPFLLKGKVKQAYTRLKQNSRDNQLGTPLYAMLKKLQKQKPVSIICHTRRDARALEMLYGLENVYHHPLAYYSSDEAKIIRSETSLSKNFPLLEKNVMKNDVLLGCFGFLGAYKGLGTAIHALKLLPSNYKLAVFGGVHPNAIQKNELINPYLDGVLKSLHAGEKAFSPTVSDSINGVQLNLNSIEELKQVINLESQEDLSQRVFFMGSLTDDMFPKAMAVCDIVLLPYVEVGQSASGPMSMAVDMGSNIIASRTKAFMQFARYYPNRFEMFDVGNYLQLSQQISSFNINYLENTEEKYNYSVASNVETYKKALFRENT